MPEGVPKGTGELKDTAELPALQDWVLPDENGKTETVVDAFPYEQSVDDVPSPKEYHPDLGPAPEVGSPDHPLAEELTAYQKEGKDFIDSLTTTENHQGVLDALQSVETTARQERGHDAIAEKFDNIYVEVGPAVEHITEELIKGNESLYTRMISQSLTSLDRLSEAVIGTSAIYDEHGLTSPDTPTAQFLAELTGVLPKMGIELDDINIDIHEVLQASLMTKKEYEARMAAIKNAEVAYAEGKGPKPAETVSQVMAEQFDRSLAYAEKARIMGKVDSYTRLRRISTTGVLNENDVDNLGETHNTNIDLRNAKFALACFEAANAGIDFHRKIMEANFDITSEEDLPDLEMLTASVTDLVTVGRVLLSPELNDAMSRMKAEISKVERERELFGETPLETEINFFNDLKKDKQTGEQYEMETYLKGDPNAADKPKLRVARPLPQRRPKFYEQWE